MADRTAERLVDLLGETRADGFEGFAAMTGAVEADNTLTAEERVRARFIRLVSVACVEALNAPADGAPTADRLLLAIEAMGIVAACLVAQGVADLRGLQASMDAIPNLYRDAYAET